MEDSIFTPEDKSVPEVNPRDVKRNYWMLSLDVIFYLFALAFMDQSTVIPAFLQTLTKNTIIIGAITAIRPAGIFLPQLWTAHYLRNRIHHKGFLVKVALISRVATALFAIVLFIAGPNDKLLILVSFLMMYSAFWTSEGYAGVPWIDLVAKSIPERLRGRLFGSTQFYGGILAIIAGLVISKILSMKNISYPTNYAILIAIAAVFFSCSLFSLNRVREPAGEPEPHDDAFIDYIRNIRTMIAENIQLKKFLIIQILIGFFGMSLPFYILYAKKTGGLADGEVGILLAIQTLGTLLSSAASGYISDKFGPRLIILATIITTLLAQALAFLILKPSFIMYSALFFIIGVVNGSTYIGLTNYLLEMADETKRKAYIGLMNTANAPTMLFPVIGGAIIKYSSYQTAFGITGAASILALVLISGLSHRESTN